MKWATRSHLHIDRTACAWLIRREIDPEAEFVFVDDVDDIPADATPFDIRGAARVAAEQGSAAGDPAAV